MDRMLENEWKVVGKKEGDYTAVGHLSGRNRSLEIARLGHFLALAYF